MPSVSNLAPPVVVAAVYVRYSSDRQRDASIEDQIRLCKELIARMGWIVGPIYIDRQISGSIVSREGFQKLRKDVRGGTFQVVVAESLDRLMRDGEASFNFGKHCRFARVQIHTHADGPATKLIMGFKGTMNDVFLDDLAEKTHRGLHGRIEDGASAGGLSYGYDVVASAESEDKGERRIDEREAEVIRRIFDDYGGSSKALGKNVGDDFREGKITLPVVLSFRRGSAEERAFWKRTLETGESTDADLETAIVTMRRHRAIEDTIERARHYGAMARDALELFPASDHKSALLDVVDFCIRRAN